MINRTKQRQIWINHLKRIDNNRLPKRAFNLKPRGKIDRGDPGNDGNASKPKHVKRPNSWRKIVMVMMINCYII